MIIALGILKPLGAEIIVKEIPVHKKVPEDICENCHTIELFTDASKHAAEIISIFWCYDVVVEGTYKEVLLQKSSYPILINNTILTHSISLKVRLIIMTRDMGLD